MKILQIFLIIFLVFLIGQCSSSTEAGSKYNPPADHTVKKDGALHKNGLASPQANCVSCHGADLKGGSSGVSCYDCHGKKW